MGSCLVQDERFGCRRISQLNDGTQVLNVTAVTGD